MIIVREMPFVIRIITKYEPRRVSESIEIVFVVSYYGNSFFSGFRFRFTELDWYLKNVCGHGGSKGLECRVE